MASDPMYVKPETIGSCPLKTGHPPKIVVAIATVGRSSTVREAILDLSHQTRAPDRIILVIAGPSDCDIGTLAPDSVALDVLTAQKGICTQRNAALVALRDEDIVLFLDDDFVMAEDFLARLEDVFVTHPDIVAVTGQVLADGIGTSGISIGKARGILGLPGPPDDRVIAVNNGYGCNMAFRCAPIRAFGLRFDEALPLYGWLEDVDFSRRIANHGRCVRAMGLCGVHLGIKTGRTSGLRLGYSQIANPIYLARRATMRRGHALRMICRNLTANAVKSLRPEPWVDRRGRLRGNLMALADLLHGRIDPQRILGLGGADGHS